jgi:hypothetical protein
MEDWAYAGSWENSITTSKPIKNCQPKIKNKYPDDRTKYDNTALRNVMYLVETAKDKKKPDESELGHDDVVFHGKYIITKGQNFIGYVPRLMRLIAATAELAKPYIDLNIEGPNGTIRYDLHGCIEVNKVVLFIIPIHEYDFDNTKIHEKYLKQTHPNVKCFINNKLSVNKTENHFNISGYNNSIVILKTLGIDYDLHDQTNPEPKVSPQSHLMKVRNEIGYSVENDNYQLKGNDKYFSNPVIITDKDKLVEVDDYSAYLLNKNKSLLSLEKYTHNEIYDKENGNKVTYSIESGLNIKAYNETSYTSDWLFEITLNFVVGKTDKVSLSDITYDKIQHYKKLEATKLFLLSKNNTINDTDISAVTNCESFLITDETYYISCLISPLEYLSIRSYLVGSFIYIDLSSLREDLYILNIFSVDNALDGKQVTGKELSCYPQIFKQLFANETVIKGALGLNRVTNLLWDRVSSTADSYVFDHFSKIDEKRFKFNSLNIIGKRVKVLGTSTQIDCILIDRYYLNDELKKLFRGEYSDNKPGETTSYNLIILCVVGLCLILLLNFLYCKFCRPNVKLGNRTYREVEIGTSQQDF